MSDAFIDQVCPPALLVFCPSMACSPTYLLQGPIPASQPWSLIDLWQKDSNGRWGKPQGTVQGRIAGVHIAPHQTSVWGAELPSNGAKRNEL